MILKNFVLSFSIVEFLYYLLLTIYHINSCEKGCSSIVIAKKLYSLKNNIEHYLIFKIKDPVNYLGEFSIVVLEIPKPNFISIELILYMEQYPLIIFLGFVLESKLSTTIKHWLRLLAGEVFKIQVKLWYSSFGEVH